MAHLGYMAMEVASQMAPKNTCMPVTGGEDEESDDMTGEAE